MRAPVSVFYSAKHTAHELRVCGPAGGSDRPRWHPRASAVERGQSPQLRGPQSPRPHLMRPGPPVAQSLPTGSLREAHGAPSLPEGTPPCGGTAAPGQGPPGHGHVPRRLGGAQSSISLPALSWCCGASLHGAQASPGDGGGGRLGAHSGSVLGLHRGAPEASLSWESRLFKSPALGRHQTAGWWWRAGWRAGRRGSQRGSPGCGGWGPWEAPSHPVPRAAGRRVRAGAPEREVDRGLGASGSFPAAASWCGAHQIAAAPLHPPPTRKQFRIHSRKITSRLSGYNRY